MSTNAARGGFSSKVGLARRLRRVSALVLLAPLLAIVGLQAPASAADNVGVPAANPSTTEAKLIVSKGGDRTASGVSALAGAQFRFYRVTSSTALSGGTLMPDTCTTDATGQCGVIVPLSGTGANYFYAEEVSAPSGWTIADVWGSSTNYLRYNSGAVQSSSSTRVRYLPETGRTWPNVRNNPAAPQKCGLDMRMVFDVSGSISDSELTTFKNAGTGVIDALANTPSRVSLSRFASQAANVLPLTSVTAASGATTVKNAINNIGRADLGGQYTNWDRALWGSATTGETYDVALIITDGDPTVYGDLTSGNTGLREVEEAIHSANALKAKNTQVIAVGIGLGAGASTKRLNLISSEGSTYTTSWETLGADLKEIASGYCNNSITVQKVVKDWQGNVMANSPQANGWQFTGSVPSPATIGAFPDTALVNGQNGFTSAPVSIGAGQTPTVTITEKVEPGWTYEGASCVVDGQNAAVTQTQTPGKFTFTGKSNAPMTCVVTNKQDPPAPKLTLVKQVLNADGSVAPASAGQAWTLSATGDGGFSGAGNTAAVTGKDVKAGVQYTLGETNVAGYTNGTTWACLKDSGPGSITFGSPNKVTLAAGQVATCAITNQVRLADLTVSKTATPQFDRDYDWTIAKSVTRGSRFEVPQGTSASVGYQVVVTPSAAKNTNFKVKGTITINNPNAVAIPAVTIADTLPGATCTLDSGAATRTIQPGSTAIPYTCVLPNGTPTTTGTNTVTLTWDKTSYHGMTGSASGTAPVNFANANVTTTDATATVTDSMIDIDGTAPDGVVVTATDGQKTFTYSRPITGVAGKCTTYDNTATVKPKDSTGTSDTETVTVCVGVDLDVDKVATLAFDREYKWKVSKSGPGHLFVGENGAMASYDVKLETDGYRDHDWLLGGTIWISNPNDWEVDATIADVTTLDGQTLTCTVTGGADVTVPANAVKKAYAYTCSGVAQGDYVGTNKATITWDKQEYFTPQGADDKEVAVNVTGVAASQNKTVSLSDVFDGGSATPVGAASYDWSVVKDKPVTVTYERPVTAQVGKCRTYDNTVSVVGTTASSTATTEVCQPGIDKTVDAAYGQRQTWSLTKDVDKTSVELGPDGTATFNYTVTATPGAVVDEGQASWSGIITVKNPSTSEVFDGTVTDTPAVTGWTCQIVGDGKVSIQPGSSANVSYTCSTAGTAHPDGQNTATVSWPGQSTAKTVGVKFASTGTIDTKTTITDDIPNDTVGPKVFEVDAAKGVQEFKYSNTTLTAVAGKCTTYTNNAVLAATGEDPTDTETVTVCREKPLAVSVEAAGSFDRDHNWDIAKAADKTTVEVDDETGSAEFGYTVTVKGLAPTDSGYELSGTATVTNPNEYAAGAITLTGGSITATHGGGVTCAPTDPIAGKSIAAGASLPIAFTCDFTGAPNPSGQVTLKVTWDPAGAADTAEASGSDDVTLVIDRERYATVDVIDDKTDPANPVLLEEGLQWKPGLVKDYTYQLTHEGVAGKCVDFTNTAIVDLTPDSEEDAVVDEDGNPTATEDVTLCVEAPLTATMAAAGDLARDYAWSIDKSVDQTSVTLNGGTALFTYTVVVKAGASKDSAWKASGVVTVTNPNAYDEGDIELTGASITNTFGPGATCAPNAAVAGTLVPAAGEEGSNSVQIPFTCTFANAPTSNTGTIEAQVTWDPVGEDSSEAVEASKGVTLAVSKETNKVVDVVDDKTVPGQRIVLEKGLVWAPGLVKSYTYSLALPAGAAGTTTPYTNTATVDLPEGPDVSDSQTVQVAVPELLPEQTYGKATGKVRASCQGTVTARMRNATGARVTYVLKVGKKTLRIKVGSGKTRVFQTKGAARSRVVLKVGPQTLDRVRVPALCLPPEVLPETGLRIAANARLASIANRWR